MPKWDKIYFEVIILNNENKSKDLNYKQAYYYLFNQTTEIMKALRIIQRKAENICIRETVTESIDTEEILKKLIEDIQSGEKQSESSDIRPVQFTQPK